MKKAIIFLIFVPMLFVYIFYSTNNNFYNSFKNLKNAEFCYVYNNEKICEYSEKIDQTFLSYKTINSGNKTFLYFNFKNNKNFLEPDYMQVVFDGSIDSVNEVINNLKLNVVYLETFENYCVFYGYATNWKKYKIIKNNKINFQIVLNKNRVTVGYPMIYASY